ncbi:hypothetical protein [Alteromonas macleodii]|uniref:hypothetical protein n=1 Tax=Alteromonas macleodii TaxID=28108 RepID=UPI00313FEA53|tara:strand:+ start:213586 stop:214314 length:729 start_codon:yes stop_codon:yes gene_type:complete
MKLNLTLKEQFACFKRASVFIFSNPVLVVPLLLLSFIAYEYTGVMGGFVSTATLLVIFAVYISKAYIGDMRALKIVLIKLIPFFIILAMGGLFSEVLNYFLEPSKIESSESAGGLDLNPMLGLLLFFFAMAFIFTILFIVKLSLFILCILKALLSLPTTLAMDAFFAMFPAIIKISVILSVSSGVAMFPLYDSRFEVFISAVNFFTSLYLVDCAATLVSLPRKPKEKKQKKAVLRTAFSVER